MVGNQPVPKFKHGSVEAAIFENDIRKDGRTFKLCKVLLQRNYLDRNDKWQSTSSLALSNGWPRCDIHKGNDRILYTLEDSLRVFQRS